MKFPLSVLQISLREDPEENLSRVLSACERSPEGGVLLLPEMFFWNFDLEKLDTFARMTPAVLEELSRLSERKNLLLCGTLPEKTEEGVRNTAYLIDRGRLIGRRSKIKLFPLFGEDRFFVAGRENPVFETRFGRIGVLICFELRFTNLVLDLRRKRIDILLVPAQWGSARRTHLEVLSRARAVELQSYLLISNIWGKLRGTEFAGRSAVYSPWGEILCFAERGDTLLTAEADLSYVGEVRRTVPVDL